MRICPLEILDCARPTHPGQSVRDFVPVLVLQEIEQLLLEISRIGCVELGGRFGAFCVDYDGLAIMVVV